MSNTTIAQAKNMFLETMEIQHSANTLQTYRKALETFSRMLAVQQLDSNLMPIAELTENPAAHFVDYVKDHSPATESLYLQVIKSFFEFLHAERLAEVNLSRVRAFIRQRARRSRRKPVPYPEEDIRYLIDFMSDLENISGTDSKRLDSLEIRNLRDRALILTLADTGLRPDEICKLRCGDVDWDAHRVLLQGRGGKQSVVRFSTRAINAIRDYLALRAQLDLDTGLTSGSLPLFARHDKGAGRGIKPITPTNTRNIVADRVHQALGAEAIGSITPHTFLHYFVTTILRATGNLKLAQMLARHASIQVTQKYAHIGADELDKGYYEIFERPEA